MSTARAGRGWNVCTLNAASWHRQCKQNAPWLFVSQRVKHTKYHILKRCPTIGNTQSVYIDSLHGQAISSDLRVSASSIALNVPLGPKLTLINCSIVSREAAQKLRAPRRYMYTLCATLGQALLMTPGCLQVPAYLGCLAPYAQPHSGHAWLDKAA
jgi:hypothetical protein